ncbi:MAG: cadmium-translocating P-type ATPase [Lentisphaerales bacterium]|nr:cadmium-translocating P-type ATPase [Lentisphaerales bacterium]
MTQDSEALEEKEEIFFNIKCILVSCIFVVNHLIFAYVSPSEDFTHGFTSFLAAVTIFIPVIRELLEDIEEGDFGMNGLVFIAMSACCAQYQFLEASIIGIIMCFHIVIESWTPSGSESNLKDVLMLDEKEVTRVESDKLQKINATEIQKDDVIRFLPGDILVVDGIISKGQSTVDKSSITGESIPQEVSEGSKILAGTVNLSGAIEVKVSASANETVISRIDRIMQEAKETKSSTVTLLDKISGPYAFCVIFFCLLVFYFTRDANQAISLMIISFPDALVMASPLAMLAALTSCARNGVLLKTPLSLLRIKECSSVLIDKTGTLTEGKLHVNKTYSETPYIKIFKDYTVALAKLSNHPVSKAIAQLTADKEYTIEEFKELHGLGISGKIAGNTIHIGRYNWIASIDKSLSLELPSNFSMVVVAINGKYAGYFKLEDNLKNEAEEAIELLKNDKFQRIKIISGDLVSRVKKIASDLQVNFRGECLPTDKIDEIKEQKKYSEVMFVGDGLNDAPAMAASDVSIAMKSDGNEFTSENADIILLRNNLLCLPYLKRLSAETNKVITQNILCGVVFVVVGMLLASTGFFTPTYAAIFHLLDAFYIVFNSARLIKVNI